MLYLNKPLRGGDGRGNFQGVGVVDDQKVRPTTGHGRANTSSEKLGALGGTPTTGPLVVVLQNSLRKHFFVRWVFDQVSDLAAKPRGQLGVMCRLNDFELRVPA